MSPSSALPTTPLIPIQSPFATLFSTLNSGQVLSIIFALVFIMWLVYSLVVAYHWFKYGHKSWFVMPALITHLFISSFLFLFAASGFQ